MSKKKEKDEEIEFQNISQEEFDKFLKKVASVPAKSVKRPRKYVNRPQKEGKRGK